MSSWHFPQGRAPAELNNFVLGAGRFRSNEKISGDGLLGGCKVGNRAHDPGKPRSTKSRIVAGTRFDAGEGDRQVYMLRASQESTLDARTLNVGE